MEDMLSIWEEIGLVEPGIPSDGCLEGSGVCDVVRAVDRVYGRCANILRYIW